LILLTYRLPEDIYFNTARFLSQLLLGYEILFIGMKSIKQGYSEARGCTQSTIGRNISCGVKFYPLFDAKKPKCCLENTVLYVSYLICNLRLGIAEADT